MLYATTRNPREAVTPAWALTEERAGDGGFYVPYREPYFYPSQLKDFQKRSFLEVEAEVLNLLFGSKISAWDLHFGAGPEPLRLQKIGRRTFSGERWRNVDFTLEGYAASVCTLLNEACRNSLGPWGEIGVGIALLTAAWSELKKGGYLQEGDTLDLAVAAEDYKAAICGLYAKAWGLPINRVVCGCLQSKGLWSLVHDGEMATDILEVDSKEVDGLEQLLNAECSQAEVRRFLNCVKRGKNYLPSEPLLKRLRQDLGVSIISPQRIRETLPGAYATHHYLLSTDGALAYAGLLDHRATIGSGSPGLILCDRSPLKDLKFLSQALSMEEDQVKKMLLHL